jgi:hypothetical protein
LFIDFECSIKVGQNSVRESQDVAKSDITDIQSVSACLALNRNRNVFVVLHGSKLPELGSFLSRRVSSNATSSGSSVTAAMSHFPVRPAAVMCCVETEDFMTHEIDDPHPDDLKKIDAILK